jgi:hypothetical protein
MYSPGGQEMLFSCIAEMEGVFSLAADPQLAENSRQGSERQNRTLRECLMEKVRAAIDSGLAEEYRA